MPVLWHLTNSYNPFMPRSNSVRPDLVTASKYFLHSNKLRLLLRSKVFDIQTILLSYNAYIIFSLMQASWLKFASNYQSVREPGIFTHHPRERTEMKKYNSPLSYITCLSLKSFVFGHMYINIKESTWQLLHNHKKFKEVTNKTKRLLEVKRYSVWCFKVDEGCKWKLKNAKGHSKCRKVEFYPWPSHYCNNIVWIFEDVTICLCHNRY